MLYSASVLMNEKELKQKLKQVASKNPEKFYAVKVLKAEGFVRKQCERCGTYFWTADEKRKFCGNPFCSGGYGFIGESPAKKKYDYIELWEAFSDMFRKLGYTPIKRYPVVARWRNDVDFVQASIYDFQPYVVSGEIKPVANPLVVPQFCLRFNDVDNVGITSAHFTGFVMIGQHAFMPPAKYDQEKYFSDILLWLTKGLGLEHKEIQFHEDSWAGGGNLGPCMEFFSRGIELGNQVYMWYKIKGAGWEDLNIKVLDMGMGHERNCWFSQGSATIYDATFPSVMKKLYKLVGLKPDAELMKRFLPLSSYLNFDETQNIEKTWRFVAKKLDLDVEELKKRILPLAALYSIAEHSRSLLVAFSDGALPSNSGGGYNLRMILRRALSFIEKYNWPINLYAVCEWHADYLKGLFPELKDNLEIVRKIIEVEKAKYKATRQKVRNIVENIVKKNKAIDEKTLIGLYDSQGITPELVKAEAEKQGLEVKIPENFYARVSALHEKLEGPKRMEEKEIEFPVADLPETKLLYLDDYGKVDFEAKVLKIFDHIVVLDKTAFYPTSGGQEHDTGKLNDQEVVDVFKQGSIVLHRLADLPKFKEGDIVKGKVDFERRKMLTQHHTAAHVLNAAARRVLGKHVNQAGAKKSVWKAHLDITHFASLTEEEVKAIEREANKIVQEDIKIHTFLMPRTEAEQRFGMTIYQGGAVPGKQLRIVEIPSVDVEACGGTHLHSTGEAKKIRIIKTTKIQDGVIRLVYVAGKAAEQFEAEEEKLVDEIASLLKCFRFQIPYRARELFEKWKMVVKKKKRIPQEEAKLKAEGEFKGNNAELLEETAKALKTQKDFIINTIKRFLKELKEKGYEVI